MTQKFWSVRPMEEDDRSFVVKSWLSSAESSAPHTKFLRLPYLQDANRALGGQLRDAWFVQYHSEVEQVVGRATCLVACMIDEPEVIVGFIVGEVHSTGPLVIHWNYSRNRYRNLGIANSLVEALKEELTHDGSVVVVTNTTPSVRLQVQRRNYHMVPMIAFQGREKRESR